MAAAATIYIGEEEEHVCGDADDDGGLQQHVQVGRELGNDLAHAGTQLVLCPQLLIDADLDVHHCSSGDGGGEEE